MLRVAARAHAVRPLLTRPWRSAAPPSPPPPPRFLASAAAAAAARAPSAPAPGAPLASDSRLPPLQPWSGADRTVVIHDDLESMSPAALITLPGTVFNAPIRSDLVHRVVVWQLAKRRSGTSKAQGRSEVSASGRKIRPQKGSGRSRQGAVSSPIFRGGGKPHGPVPRSYDFPLPKNVIRNALRSTLTSKLASDQLWIVESATVTDSKTKNIKVCMERHQWRSALIVDDVPHAEAGVHHTLYRASHNVHATLAMNIRGLNVYDALSFDMLVLTRAAVEHLSSRYATYEWLF